MAQAIAGQCLRPGDLVARYGGEEFALVLAETDASGAAALLRAILGAVDRLAIEHTDSTCSGHVTISVGALSLRPGPQHTVHAALKRADELLYLAKEQGRHRAMHADETGAVCALAA